MTRRHLGYNNGGNHVLALSNPRLGEMLEHEWCSLFNSNLGLVSFAALANFESDVDPPPRLIEAAPANHPCTYDGCSFRFGSQQALREHVCKLHNVNPWRRAPYGNFCPWCGSTFARRAIARIHCALIHRARPQASATARFCHDIVYCGSGRHLRGLCHACFDQPEALHKHILEHPEFSEHVSHQAQGMAFEVQSSSSGDSSGSSSGGSDDDSSSPSSSSFVSTSSSLSPACGDGHGSSSSSDSS